MDNVDFTVTKREDIPDYSRVRVTFEYVSSPYNDTQMEWDGVYKLRIPKGAEIKFEILDPPSWPPQIGDIWEAGGSDYYVRGHHDRPGSFVVQSFDNTGTYYDLPSEDLARFKALNPRLIRRREV